MKIKPLNKKLIQLVKLLSDGNYHDGNVLGESLKITRSAVWKMIKKLEQYGITVDSIRSNGYALQESLILLEPNRIKKSLTYELELTVLESVDSTNNFLKNQTKKSPIRGCFSEHQTQGRSRLNRTWHSPFGKNLYFSCGYLFQKDVSELAGLSLAVSLSIFNTLQTLGITEEMSVKWPNDVLCHNKKIAGVLIDVQAESHGVTNVIIGIGLNVNMLHSDIKQSDEMINQAWTSLQEEKKVSYDRNYVAAILVQCLLEYLNRFEQYGFQDFTEEWKQTDALAKKNVTLNYNNHLITGEVLGINPQGHLLLRQNDGTIRAFSSGDASLLKK